jgi:hypothetical protein
VTPAPPGDHAAGTDRSPLAALPASARFVGRRLLGAGAFGAVYEALDVEREAPVALKVLHQRGGAALLGLKREFRSLADIRHPNLVRLHELVGDGEQWFFTMELVDGTDFLSFVRGGAPGSEATAATVLGPPSDAEDPAHADTVDAAPAATGAQLERLRAVFGQLAEGLAALHAGGKLHRDLKPSNVLVTREGRVVIVDFGLAVAAAGAGADDGELAGTPAYMAPEQVREARVSPACDWYAAGVMLHEALTGRLPFEGAPLAMLAKKMGQEPRPPSLLAPGTPPDLDRLCVELLRLAPEARPRAEEVLARLRGGPRAPSVAPAEAAPFVGREAQLATLEDALAAVSRGAARTVHVRGASGMGKSALIRRFLDDLAGRDGLVVLEGRCYEREAVPYKALDSLVDALSQHLARLPIEQAAALLPGDVHAAARLFPVLERVEAIAAAPRPELAAPEPHARRRRGFAALRALFAAIAARRLLVLHVDDLQWGDGDSAALLAELLRPPGAPALLFLASYRSDDADRSALLGNLPAWLAWAPRGDAPEGVGDVVVGPLAPEEATSLAAALLGPAAGALAEAVAAESGGSPFFVQALAEAVQERRRAGAPGGDVRLSSVLTDRLAALPEGARRLLEIVAATGRPLDRSVAMVAAGLGPAEIREMVASLCHAHLLRVRGPREREELDTFHSRIRDAALAEAAPPRLRALHLDLATALEASGAAEPHVLAVHFQRAGEIVRATRYAVLAGDRAAQALAFERAAELYRSALDLGGLEGAPRHAVRVALGDALGNAGRGAEAAGLYLEALAGASPDEALELRRRAAESFLRSGYIDEGTTHLRAVVAAAGLDFPESLPRALASLLVRRAHLRLRGLAFDERSAARVPRDELSRVDVCWSAALGLGMVDPVRAAGYQAQNLLFALRAGEPYRVARAVAFEAGLLSTNGLGDRPRVEELLGVARALARRTGHPHALGLTEFTTGIARYCFGEFGQSLAALDRAEAVLRERCAGATWERGSAMAFAAWDLFLVGDLRELARRLPIYLRDAEERGDRYFATHLRTCFSNAHWLVVGEPDTAAREVDAAMARWSRAGFHLQHFLELVARAHIHLYRGDGAAALRAVEAAWPTLRSSFTLRMQVARVWSHQLHGRAALATASTSRDAKALVRSAERSAAAIDDERAGWGEPLAAQLRAGVAARRRDAAGAARHLRDAARGFDAAGMALFAAAARRRLGEVLGGEEGRALVEAASAWMRAQGVADPERITAMLAPGFG